MGDATKHRRGSAQAKRLGRAGEWAALVLLLLKGYRLRHRRWSCPAGELDLVMLHRRTVVFVEVKTRSSPHYGGAAAAVDRSKQQRLVRLASTYMSRFNLWDTPCRFDVIAIERSGGFPAWRIRHYRDAFQPELGRQV